MATLFLISNPISHATKSFTFPSFRTLPSRNSPPPLVLNACRRPRGATVLTRAGANASSYAFAIALPLSLLAVTVFTALRIGQKLDQDFYEEVKIWIFLGCFRVFYVFDEIPHLGFVQLHDYTHKSSVAKFRLFCFAVNIVDFELIDYVKLILTSSKFKVSWFMFGYIYCKSEFNNKFECQK
jgi:hypothetical protein